MRAALVPTLLLCATVALAEPQLTVDANDLIAHIAPLHGVNCGPLEFSGQLAGQNLESLYRQMGIPLIRAHDLYGPCDFATIFPSSLTGWNGDAYSDAGYDFDSSDDAIEAMEGAGAEIMFRLGDSWNNDDPRDEHPPDFGLVAHVCRHIVQHYGADSGRILMWEIWNEPDHPMFWEQTPNAQEAMREFYTLYAICAKKLKGKWPTLTVGGPGMAGGTTEQIAADAQAFARACAIKDAPLDFYSWHSYNRNGDGPYIFAEQAQAVRAALDAEGFGNTVSILSEWNVASVHTEGAQGDLRWNMDGAAFTAAALTYLHRYSDLKYACRYRGDWHTGDEGFGLVNGDGSLKLPGLAFVAYSGLFPQWLLVTRPEMYRLGSGGGDTTGRALIATTDSGRRCVNILVSLYQTGGEGFALRVNNVPHGWSSPRMEHHILTSQRPYELVSEGGYDNSAPFTLTWPADGQMHSEVHFIRLYDAAHFPHDLTPMPAPLNLPTAGPAPGPAPRPLPRPRPRLRPWPPRP